MVLLVVIYGNDFSVGISVANSTNIFLSMYAGSLFSTPVIRFGPVILFYIHILSKECIK